MYGKGYSIVAKNLGSAVLQPGLRFQLHSLLVMGIRTRLLTSQPPPFPPYIVEIKMHLLVKLF